ncbi:hypothetical protein BDB00DRAFT_831329 [Zychaea mexicana]|uniref:uncharacterized protein n=1 Tax=Zychaea mexicana TaxID=64656 RepID=UPI0022FDF9CA|nr:uncharacterized protein BDB00DRAFT_831329 [Zychaea mexicana]KAI9491756.1 hypothetical protein BDB00DRAFT_831329 [Zychaea mexicana]
MAFQFGNTSNNEKWVLTNASKRRMDDDDDDDYAAGTATGEEGIKRLQNQQHHQQKTQIDLTTQNQPNLPSITFASADYRPPPRPDALWLRAPPPATHTVMDEDLTDEDDGQAVLTPSTSLQHPSTSKPHQYSTTPLAGYGVATPPM